MIQPSDILSQWWDAAALADAKATPYVAAGSFSGARIWRVLHGGQWLALRRWPPGGLNETQLAAIHALQLHLVEQGVTFVPAPIACRTGSTFVRRGDALYELAPWMPGTADYWQAPRTAKLAAALKALATVHVAAASLHHANPLSAAMAELAESFALKFSAEHQSQLESVFGEQLKKSRALERRRQRIDMLRESQLDELAAADRPADAREAALRGDALKLLRQVIPREDAKGAAWKHAELPLQWRIGDVWHDHLLFTGDDVTGLVDFGAASYDAPAGDVARLLGSLVGDDAELWRRGIAAYVAVRPMTPLELAAVQYFDSTGTVISTANWLQWLWPRHPARSQVMADRAAGLERLGKLVQRLRVLAEHGK